MRLLWSSAAVERSAAGCGACGQMKKRPSSCKGKSALPHAGKRVLLVLVSAFKLAPKK